MNIKKAVLHVMDKNNETYFLSDVPLILDLNLSSYLMKHLEKIRNSANGQKGIFKENASLKNKIMNYQDLDFVGFTKSIASEFFDVYMEALRFYDMNLLFVEYEFDDVDYFAMLKFNNKSGYMRSVDMEDTRIATEIITHYALLPTTSQQIEEYFNINLNDYTILFKEDKKYFNSRDTLLMSDDILNCDGELSTKDSLKVLDEIVMSVSDALDEDVLENTLKMKQFVKSCVESDRKIDVDDIGDVVYPNQSEFKEKLSTVIEEKKLPKVIPLQKSAPVAMRKHKIKTDLGIEISVPIDFMESKDMFHIIKNNDGTISLELKNIGKVIQ